MDQETKQLVQERYQELPQILQNALLRPTLTSSIRLIAEKHHLPTEKASLLEDEVVLTLLAFEPLTRFDERIMAELLIPGSVAASVARDLDEMIFTEVREDLTEITKEHEEHDKMEEKEMNSSVDVVPSRSAITPMPPVVPQTPAPSPVAQMPRYVKDDPYRESPK